MKDDSIDEVTAEDVVDVMDASPASSIVQYRLYRWRFPGAFGLLALNLIGGMNWPWFGAISYSAAEDFGISVTRINWLGNTVALVFIPVSIGVPFLIQRVGIRATSFVGAVCLIIAAWVRYAGTIRGLDPGGAYALLLIGQMFGGIAQPIFQVLGPKYSEKWFDLKGRTTATMLISIANPVGAALGQLLPPIVGTPRQSVLVLGIISTAVFPAALLISSQPPTPPTFSGGQPSPPPMSTLRAALGRPRPADRPMSPRQRLDLAILVAGFGIYVGCTNAFSLLTSQMFEPYGYSETTAGLFGAVLLLSGLLAAFVTAPLFDRVFTQHMALAIRILAPILSLGWLSMIWAVRFNDVGGIFAVMAVLGVVGLTLLPITLELGCEVTGNPEFSAALLWCSANAITVIFTSIENALTAGPDDNPPRHLQRANIFVGVIACVMGVVVQMLKGDQSRRALDVAKQQEANHMRGQEVS